ncbi:MAG: alpha/beta hydrolase [Alphaproteobacteria bacterium]|nr:MAG: alpha/beta hydrolase [Alphaproteobacteria bacterium]
MTGLFTIVFLYMAGLALLYAFQRSLLYFPDPQHVAPGAINHPAEEILLETPDGETVYAWWHAPSDDKRVILHFHGNGGSLVWRIPRYRKFTDNGYGLLAMTYRGYSGSSGSPSEAAIIADALLAYDWLLDKGIEPDRIVLYGESLGAGVAVQVAAEKDVKAVILESPYNSARAVAQSRFPMFPIAWLMKDPFESDRYIDKIHAPLVIIHGRKDKIIPFHHGESLYALAHEPKRFIALDDGTHNDLFSQGAGDIALDYLSEIAPGRRSE